VVTDGPKEAVMPIVGMAILLTSYIYYHRIYAPFKSN
jgi:hypothetical protein